MKASIIKIGNSHGVRIPKPIIKQCGFGSEVELEVHNHELVIKSTRHPREKWEEAFQVMAGNGDDKLIDFGCAIETKWDEEDWEWE